MVDLCEEVIIKIVGKCNLELQGIDQIKLRNILTWVLSNYEISCSEKSLVVSDLEEKLKMFLIVRKMDGLSKLTLQSYAREIMKFGETIYKPTNMINTIDIRKYLVSICGNVKNSTYATKVSTLKTFFSWLSNEKMIESNPCKAIATPKVDKRIRKALEPIEVELLRNACQTYREKSIFELFINSGIRLSELNSINTGDIDFNNNSLFVIGKGNKERRVLFDIKTKIRIQEYIKSKKGNDKALFVSSKYPYKRLGNRAIEREVKNIAERSSVDRNVFCHILRHTCCTNMVSHNVPMPVVQEIMGHSSLVTTAIYFQLNDKKIKEEYDKVH